MACLSSTHHLSGFETKQSTSTLSYISRSLQRLTKLVFVTSAAGRRHREAENNSSATRRLENRSKNYMVGFIGDLVAQKQDQLNPGKVVPCCDYPLNLVFVQKTD